MTSSSWWTSSINVDVGIDEDNEDISYENDEEDKNDIDYEDDDDEDNRYNPIY